MQAGYNEPVRIFSLEGKTALVAGASRGIGLAIAREMAAAGASVILAARSQQELEARAAEIGGRALRLDVRDPESIAAAVEAAGTPDILVNVAGINIRKRFEDYTEEEYQRIFDTNLHGLVRLTRAVGARMIARGQGGKIIAGLHHHGPEPQDVGIRGNARLAEGMPGESESGHAGGCGSAGGISGGTGRGFRHRAGDRGGRRFQRHGGLAVRTVEDMN